MDSLDQDDPNVLEIWNVSLSSNHAQYFEII
jgi:hypothetical protein